VLSSWRRQELDEEEKKKIRGASKVKASASKGRFTAREEGVKLNLAKGASPLHMTRLKACPSPREEYAATSMWLTGNIARNLTAGPAQPEGAPVILSPASEEDGEAI
jgi:hypothetical protein